MKRCPACGRTFTNKTLVNCLNDGAVLMEDVPTASPYAGASPATPPTFAETPSLAETPLSAPLPETSGTTTYTDMPLSAIPELQSPEMQVALKEALDKAGMSSLFGADLSAKATVSITTSTTSQSGTPLAAPGVPPSPSYAKIVAPRRKRLPWGGWVVLALIVYVFVAGVRYLGHKADAPPGAAPAVNRPAAPR